MNPEQSQLRQQQRAEQEHTHGQFQHGTTQAQVKEFASVDDLLRFDSDQNPVPAEVADRLNQSLAAEPKAQRPWYRKLFGS